MLWPKVKNLLFVTLVMLRLPLFAQDSVTVTYSASDAVIFNPERGFSAYCDNAISSSLTASLKAQNISLIQRIYTIPQYHNQALPQRFLDLMRNDFNTAREGGMKVIVRFSYTDDQNGEDAALDTILMHINQITPLLQDNYDVIAYMEAGFIGAWGEWYYSSHNLNNTNDRRSVLYALLDALPEQRAVVVRTPDYKRLIYNDNTPISSDEAFSGSKKARTGAHNDCFLADETDAGTYLYNNIEGDKDYLHQDNLYVPQGGETCSPSAYSGCQNALKDLARMRWSALNKDYNGDVLAGWQSGGCMDEIKKRLGYRFILLQAVMPDSLKPGAKFSMSFDLYNHGFANPYNPRLLEIILRHTQSGATYRLPGTADARFWHPEDTVHVQLTGGLPADLPEGAYECLLHLADPVEALRYRPEYAIQLANENVWEDSTGYNKLLHVLTVAHNASGELYTGADYFEPFSATPPPPPPQSDIVIDGQFEDWARIPQIDIPPDDENSGDALNDDVDLIDLWVTDDRDNIYISYQVAGSYVSSYFYHVFFDTDGDSATGFHSGGSYMGIDYMIENSSLWKYSGQNGAWGWTYVGEAIMAQGVSQRGRVEMALAKAQLELPQSAQTVELLFNINDNDESFKDDYAPDAFTQRSYSYTFVSTAIQDRQTFYAPHGFGLHAYPNPFNGSIQICFSGTTSNNIQARIYDIRGRLIKRLPDVRRGQTSLNWDGLDEYRRSVSSGVYILQLKSKQITDQIKLLLQK